MISGVILALTCAKSQLNQRNNILDQAVSNNVARLKRSQQADGGFGNTYATSIAIQVYLQVLVNVQKLRSVAYAPYAPHSGSCYWLGTNLGLKYFRKTFLPTSVIFT